MDDDEVSAGPSTPNCHSHCHGHYHLRCHYRRVGVDTAATTLETKIATNSHNVDDNTDATAVNHGVKTQNKLQLPLNSFILNLQSVTNSRGASFLWPS